jgi:hypothetical protein
LKAIIFFATKKRSKFLNHEDKEYCPGNIKSYFIRDRKGYQEYLYMAWSYTRCWNIDCLCSIYQLHEMTKKKRICKKYGLLPHKISEPDRQSLGYNCVDLVGPFKIRKTSKTHSLIAIIMINPEMNKGWFDIVEATNKSSTSIQDLFFITLGCHVTRDLNLLYLSMVL